MEMSYDGSFGATVNCRRLGPPRPRAWADQLRLEQFAAYIAGMYWIDEMAAQRRELEGRLRARWEENQPHGRVYLQQHGVPDACPVAECIRVERRGPKDVIQQQINQDRCQRRRELLADAVRREGRALPLHPFAACQSCQAFRGDAQHQSRQPSQRQELTT